MTRKTALRKYNIPIFIPHEGCPHDCTFCNQRKITGIESSVSPEGVVYDIHDYLSTIKTQDCDIEIAFFGGSFTGLSLDLQEQFLKAAASVDDSRIKGIRISTRPDYIDETILEQCLRYGVKTIELGVQSSNNDVLELNHRGHVFKDVVKSAKLIHQSGIELGLQMMLGMYGSDPEKDIKTCNDIIDLQPKSTRIYPTLVLGGTELETFYNQGKYSPYDIETAVETAKECIIRFRENEIDIIRIGLYSSDDLRSDGNIISGPFHPAFGEMAENRIYRDEIEKEIISKNIKDCEYIVMAKPSETSKIIGQKKCNKIYFNEKYGVSLKVKTISV